MSKIHPSAVIDPKAELDSTVEVGPFSIVGPHVRLGAGVVLRPHTHITGHTEIGAETVIFPFASVGEAPQDNKYKGEPTKLTIGERNMIREYVTLHPGTPGGAGLTSIGDDNLFMIGVHVGHDCHVGHHVIMANQVAIAGHVRVEDHAVLGAAVHVHQFVRIGESAMCAALAGVSQDVAPFCLAQGYPSRLLRVNGVNMERRGFGPERLKDIQRAFRIIFRQGLRPHEAFAQVRETIPDSQDAERMVAFLEKSERGFCRVR